MSDRRGDDARSAGRGLLVLRHAKSAWDTEATTDLERPLAPRGQEDAPRMGSWMRERGLLPDHVVCSPARRARQTLEHVLGALGPPVPEAVRIDERIYGADLPHLLGVLADSPPRADLVLVVGHNPGLEILLRYLAADWSSHAARAKFLPTCTLAHLAMPDDWSDLSGGEATLRAMVRPKDL